MIRRQFTAELLIRVRWMSLAVVLLCLGAILWVLIEPTAWTSCLVLVAAAVPLAIIERDAIESDRHRAGH